MALLMVSWALHINLNLKMASLMEAVPHLNSFFPNDSSFCHVDKKEKEKTNSTVDALVTYLTQALTKL